MNAPIPRPATPKTMPGTGFCCHRFFATGGPGEIGARASIRPTTSRIMATKIATTGIAYTRRVTLTVILQRIDAKGSLPKVDRCELL